MKNVAGGNIIKHIFPEQYDEKTDGGAGCSYEYDSWDSLVFVTNLNGTTEHRLVGRLITATGGGMQYRYSYYNNGRLMEK